MGNQKQLKETKIKQEEIAKPSPTQTQLSIHESDTEIHLKDSLTPSTRLCNKIIVYISKSYRM